MVSLPGCVRCSLPKLVGAVSANVKRDIKDSITVKFIPGDPKASWDFAQHANGGPGRFSFKARAAKSGGGVTKKRRT
jgi:hypothetical protein